GRRPHGRPGHRLRIIDRCPIGWTTTRRRPRSPVRRERRPTSALTPERSAMATFVLIHGGGDVGWSWHLVEAELRQRGHDVVAPDLPCDDNAASLHDYADAVVEAIGDRRDLI